MPQTYVVESICDRIAACKVYQKEQYTQASPLNYYLNSNDEQNLHPLTANLFERILRYIQKNGEEDTFKRIKELLHQQKDLYKSFWAIIVYRVLFRQNQKAPKSLLTYYLLYVLSLCFT